jgi:hypothetical protein
MSTSIARGNLLKVFALQVSIDVTSKSAATTAEQDITITGVKTGDIVLSVNKPTLSAGLGIANARVKSDDTVAVTFINATAGAIDPAAETYTFVIGRPEPMGSIFNA